MVGVEKEQLTVVCGAGNVPVHEGSTCPWLRSLRGVIGHVDNHWFGDVRRALSIGGIDQRAGEHEAKAQKSCQETHRYRIWHQQSTARIGKGDIIIYAYIVSDPNYIRRSQISAAIGHEKAPLRGGAFLFDANNRSGFHVVFAQVDHSGSGDENRAVGSHNNTNHQGKYEAFDVVSTKEENGEQNHKRGE